MNNELLVLVLEFVLVFIQILAANTLATRIAAASSTSNRVIGGGGGGGGAGIGIGIGITGVLNTTTTTTTSTASLCPLLWNSKQNLGYEIGFQLQVCCNVSTVKLWPIYVNSAGYWSRGALTYEKNFKEEPNDIWSELQVSICDDKSEPTLGYAEPREGIQCTHHKGQTLTISPETIQTDRWYLICYTKTDGCSQCHLEALCDNEFTSECADIWMLNSVSTITNDSMRMWMRIGKRYPFLKETSIQITVRDQARDRQVAHYERIPQPNKQHEIQLDGLQPNGWYLVQTCLRIRPPKSFISDNDVQLNEHSRQMCKTGSYRTKASSRAYLSRYSSIVVYLQCFLIVLFSCFVE